MIQELSAECTILLLFVCNNRFLFLVSVCCVSYTYQRREEAWMSRLVCRDFLEEYFEGKYKLLPFIKRDACSCDRDTCTRAHRKE